MISALACSTAAGPNGLTISDIAFAQRWATLEGWEAGGERTDSGQLWLSIRPIGGRQSPLMVCGVAGEYRLLADGEAVGFYDALGDALDAARLCYDFHTPGEPDPGDAT